MQAIITEVLKNFPFYLNSFIQLVGAITVIATFLVKLTGSPKDDEAIEGFKLKWHKFLAWLPTVGYNVHQDVVNDAEEKKPDA